MTETSKSREKWQGAVKKETQGQAVTSTGECICMSMHAHTYAHPYPWSINNKQTDENLNERTHKFIDRFCKVTGLIIFSSIVSQSCFSLPPWLAPPFSKLPRACINTIMVASDALAPSSNPSQSLLETIEVLIDKHSVRVYLKTPALCNYPTAYSNLSHKNVK